MKQRFSLRCAGKVNDDGVAAGDHLAHSAVPRANSGLRSKAGPAYHFVANFYHHPGAGLVWLIADAGEIVAFQHDDLAWFCCPGKVGHEQQAECQQCAKKAGHEMRSFAKQMSLALFISPRHQLCRSNCPVKCKLNAHAYRNGAHGQGNALAPAG